MPGGRAAYTEDQMRNYAAQQVKEALAAQSREPLTDEVRHLISYLERHAGAYVLPGWDGYRLAELLKRAHGINKP